MPVNKNNDTKAEVLLQNGLVQFENQEYKKSYENFTICKNLGSELTIDLAKKLLISKLKINSPESDVSENNSLFKRLMKKRGNFSIKIYKEKSVLTFGKHKSKKISDIVKNHPSYLVKSINTMDFFSVGYTIMLHDNIINQQGYFEALENNLAKIAAATVRATYAEQARLEMEEEIAQLRHEEASDNAMDRATFNVMNGW
jgi:hypothetical protein